MRAVPTSMFRLAVDKSSAYTHVKPCRPMLVGDYMDIELVTAV